MDNWTAISNFGKIKFDWLKNYFPFENGIPSHDVLGNVFAAIDSDVFSVCFTDWINSRRSKKSKTVKRQSSALDDNYRAKLLKI